MHDKKIVYVNISLLRGYIYVFYSYISKLATSDQKTV